MKQIGMFDEENRLEKLSKLARLHLIDDAPDGLDPHG